MTAATVLRYALAGSRTDGVRIALTAVGGALATLGLLAIATVLSITNSPPGANGAQHFAPYTSGLLAEPGLRPGLSFALALLTIPVLFFVAQCTRLGAPARDRRLAAYRLGGATPGQAARIAATETGIAASLGVGLGAAAYFVGRVAADRPNAQGLRPLPTNVLPPVPIIVLILAGVPLLAVGLSVVLLRRVRLTPFGVVRRSRNRRVRPWPGLLVGVGLGGVVVATSSRFAVEGQVGLGVLVGVFVVSTLLMSLGLLFGTGWFAYTGGRLLHRYARKPAALLAARRLLADPWAASRVLSVIVISLLFGAGAAGTHAGFRMQARADAMNMRLEAQAHGRRFVTPDTSFYQQAFDLIDVAVGIALMLAAAGMLVLLAERIVSGRRSLAALVATGTPRSTLVRAQLIQTFVPLVATVVLATVVGWFATWVIFGSIPAPVQDCTGAEHVCRTVAWVHLSVPWTELVALAGGAVVAVLAATALSMVFLRSSTDIGELRAE